MNEPQSHTQSSNESLAITSGNYSGAINGYYENDSLLAAFASLPEKLKAESAELIAGGRNHNWLIELPFGGNEIPVLVKSFGRQGKVKDWIDLTYRNSKAQRSFEAALHLHCNGVGTPEPIAFLERRQGSRLQESYFLSLYAKGTRGFHEIFIEMLHSRPNVSELMPLLMTVAESCKDMHDAGYMHNDLGNQNILIKEAEGQNHGPALFIDLNRGRRFAELSLQQRGQDLSRLNIPGLLMEMFLDMYWGSPAPSELVAQYDRHRSRFLFRDRSRKWRHPIREARIAKESALIPAGEKFPSLKDIWIWDDLSDQSLGAASRHERKKLYPANRSWRLAADSMRAGWDIRRQYRKIKQQVYTGPVSMTGRLGVSLAPAEETFEDELALLNRLNIGSVLVRVCHHESAKQLAYQMELIKRLSAAGHDICLALVQDREAILHSAHWEKFVLDVLANVGTHIRSMEFGHAINRVKWGIWDFHELRKLYKPLPRIKSMYPGLEIIGPATIDFEYAFMLSALRDWPKEVPLGAVSHHLYVDRRGAPENLQSGFNLIDKCVLAKAIAQHHDSDNSKVIISEVNWPIAGTGKHSPVTVPFDYRNLPEISIDESGVDEQLYASYMIRYLVLSLCSGTVERIYWWRLVARGYGLANLTDTREIRLRPGFTAFQHFQTLLGQATFVSADIPEQKGSRHGLYRFWFESEEGEKITVCWSHGAELPLCSDMSYQSAENVFGATLDQTPHELSGSPVYFRHCKKS